MVAFEVDLRGYRFGYRQALSFATAAVVVLALVPPVIAAADGAWDAPRLDLGRTLGFLDKPHEGGFRTLWIGDPDVLPIAAYRLDDDLGYALSDDGLPDVVDRVATSPSASVELVSDALHLVAEGRSDRLGRLLAPFGIRYVVLLRSSAPARANGVNATLPRGLEEMISRQLDLHRVQVDPAIDLFESAAWMPVRAELHGGAADAASSTTLFSTAATTDFSGADPATGSVGPGVIHYATPYSSRWHLDGATHTKSLGWANGYELDEATDATLTYKTSPTRWLAIAAQLLLVAIAISVARRKRERIVDDEHETLSILDVDA
jgi:hypothetical protein